MVEKHTLTGQVIEYDGLNSRVLETPFGSVSLDSDGSVTGYLAPFEYFAMDTRSREYIEQRDLTVYIYPERVYIPLDSQSGKEEISKGVPYLVNEKHLFEIVDFTYLTPNIVGGPNEDVQKLAICVTSDVDGLTDISNIQKDYILLDTLETVFETEDIQSLLPLHL